MPSVEAFLAEVERLPPPVTLETDEPRGWAVVRAGTRLIGRVDLVGARALVSVPRDRVGAVRRQFPSSHPAADGIAFGLEDARSRSEALAAIRRRAHVQRLASQFRAASP